MKSYRVLKDAEQCRSRLPHDGLFLQHVADRLNDELRLLQMDIVFALFGDPKLSMR